jgi:hypothetical protein
MLFQNLSLCSGIQLASKSDSKTNECKIIPLPLFALPASLLLIPYILAELWPNNVGAIPLQRNGIKQTKGNTRPPLSCVDLLIVALFPYSLQLIAPSFMGETEIKKGTQIATKGTKGPSLFCFGGALWQGTLCVVGQLLPAALGLELG